MTPDDNSEMVDCAQPQRDAISTCVSPATERFAMISDQFIPADYRNLDICVKQECATVLPHNCPMRTEFGRRLVLAREHAELTQEEAADKVGMGQSTLAQAEAHGHRSGFTAQLAVLYGVSPVWLASGKGTMLPAGTGMIYNPPPEPPENPAIEALLADYTRLPKAQQDWIRAKITMMLAEEAMRQQDSPPRFSESREPDTKDRRSA